jgi:hypothetical protein
MPRTGRPDRFTTSWNMRVCWDSSMISWWTYRNSGAPLGSRNARTSRPRCSRFSNCQPVFIEVATR